MAIAGAKISPPEEAQPGASELMSRLVQEAGQFPAEAAIALRQLAGCRHRIAFIVAAGLLANLSITHVRAQSYPAQYLAAVWQTEQGLPQNSVNALLQDRNGYLWIGTFGGLVRFDGERLRVLGTEDFPGMMRTSILSLYEGRSGALWIGTAGSGLMRLDHGVVTTYTERDGLPSGFINSLRGDAQGQVWANTSGGLAHFDGAKWQPQPTYRGKPVREFYLQALDGSMWLRNGEEVMRFGADGSFTTFNAGKRSKPKLLRLEQSLI
jgi:ligand-binding sensor domain-containing protein